MEETMKFIHTGDIHWGMFPDSDKPWSRDRAQAIKESFEEIIRLAREKDVDFADCRGFVSQTAPGQGFKRGQLPVFYNSLRAGGFNCRKSRSYSGKFCTDEFYLVF